MNSILRHLTVVAALAAAGAAAAADIELYEGENYGGRRIQANASISNLASANFNDRASSVTIREGQWQICSDAYFRGRCVTLGPGNYPNLRSMGLNDAVSSVRDLWDQGGSGGNAGGGRGALVVLYDSDNLNGVSFRVDGPIPNLDGTNFNDRARSMVVREGSWELCGDANFRGGCQVYGPGRYDNLGALGGRLSSLRPTAGGPVGGPVGGAPGGGPGGGGNWGGGTRAVLYEGPNLTGRVFVVERYMPNLDGTGFNDRASSLRVERGYWLFCTDANFQGECRTFGPGDYPSLHSGMNNRISSGRRISDDYPYGSNPNWGGTR